MTHPRRFVTRSSRAAIVAVTLLLFAAGSLLAHATLLRSNPAKDEHVAVPPTVLRLEFSEAVTPSTSRIELVASDSARIVLAPRASPDSNVKVLEADVPELTVAGPWRVEWRLIGADGHPVTGRYTFTVDSIPVPVMDTTPAVGAALAPDEPGFGFLAADSVASTGLRLVTIVAMVLLVGVSLLALRMVRQVAAGLPGDGASFATEVYRRLGALARPAAWLLAVALPIRLLLQAGSLAGTLGGVAVSDLAAILMRTWWGFGWTLQVIGAVAALAALGRQRRSGGLGAWRGVAAAAVLLAGGASMMGHPAAMPEAPVIAMGLDALHALGAGGWVGGLAGLTIVVLPVVFTLPDEMRVKAVRHALRLFSPIALTAAGVLVVTGLVGAWWQLRGDLSALLTSSWGRLLIAKLATVLVVAALGAFHWKVVQPAIRSDRSLDRLRVSVRGELHIMGLVVVLTAVLTGTATAGLPQ